MRLSLRCREYLNAFDMARVLILSHSPRLPVKLNGRWAWTICVITKLPVLGNFVSTQFAAF